MPASASPFSFMQLLARRVRSGGAGAAVPELGDETCERPLNIVTGCAFWRRLRVGIEVVCVGELRGALMAHSALGCPGVSTLLANLCHTVEEAHVPLAKVGEGWGGASDCVCVGGLVVAE